MLTSSFSSVPPPPPLFKRPHRDAKCGERRLLKAAYGTDDLPLMYCYGRFPSSSPLARTSPESEPDVRVFADTSPRPDVSLLYWQLLRRAVGGEC